MNQNRWSVAVVMGARLLDERQEGWWKEENINLDTLDMNCPFNCVLAQLYGTYTEGREELGIEYAKGDHYGFDCYTASQFELLTELWSYLIKARRETAA
jgi:hypothetical protein